MCSMKSEVDGGRGHRHGEGHLTRLPSQVRGGLLGMLGAHRGESGWDGSPDPGPGQGSDHFDT